MNEIQRIVFCLKLYQAWGQIHQVQVLTTAGMWQVHQVQVQVLSES